MTIPAFNVYLCGSSTCTRDDANQDLCPLPAVMFQFFLVAAEGWFFAHGLELYSSITNPFSNFQSR
jgi:hypothetical protein